ncbi:MAG: LPXTG cell wall anchor domain-containing protein [Acidimicrobiia bacterium]|nr:LPXTG cell wall anchor domain-containing protein [Acidimicrobiia bacterium]
MRANSSRRKRTGRTGAGRRRLAVAALAVSLLTAGLAAPAGAASNDPTPQETIAGVIGQAQQHGADAQAFVNGHVPEAQARLAEIQRQAQAGNWPEVKRLSDELKADAVCVGVEFDLNYIPADNKFASMTIDKEAGVARAQIVIPEGCSLPQPIPVTLVSWVMDAAQAWGTSPQGQTDITETVWVQDAGTYNFEVDLPRPTTDADAIRATLERDGLGTLIAAADDTGGAFDLDAIIGVVTSDPELLDLILTLVCPFQVDLFAAEAQTIPTQLGGLSNGTPVPSNAHLGIDALIEGKVGEWDSAKQYSPVPDFAENFPQVDFDESLDDSLQAAAAADPELASTLDSIPWEILCAEEPPEVGGETVEAIPVSTGGDSGAPTAVAGTALPRTGSETPGVVAMGIAMILAGWLLLVTRAFLGLRRRPDTTRLS